MGRAGQRPALTVVLATAVAAVLVLPAGASALDGGGTRTPSYAASRDAGDALAEQAQGHAAAEPHTHDPGDFQNSILAAAHLSREAGEAPSARATLPTGFSDQVVVTGMSEAVSADFAPDGTAFVALKTGQVKVAAYNGTTGTWGAPTDFADLQTQVDNYGDRGLTGIAVDPQFPTRPYVYVNYTYDKDPRDGVGGVVPKWGVGTAYDDCPNPATEANPSIAGCIVQDRVTRLTASHSTGAWRMTSEKELLVSGCYQFSSHASGDVAFGPDGKLYASSGEGASFNTQDYGQYANPCPGDPANEGGSLRSQDYRTSGDALGVDGSVFRMDPDSGIVPTQDNASSWLVAYGQRNPWRLAFRPKADGSGTSNELWSADVGASKAEEVNRIPDVAQVAAPVNRGWPCYEGNYAESAVQPAWQALNKPLCKSLYDAGLGAVQKPVFSYQTRDGGPLVTGEDCANETSSVSGVAFGGTWVAGPGNVQQNSYPASYQGAMFFSDFARSCLWYLEKKPDGEPDPTKIRTFVQAAATPVDLLTGPGGDLYYVDYGLTAQGAVNPGHAAIHRIVYTGSNAAPTARITADTLSGPAPLTVNFSGSTSSDPDGDPLTYSWDLDGNGSFETTGVSPSRTYAVGTVTVSLKVDDGHGHTHTTTAQVQSGNTAPTLGTVTPSASLTWAAGDTISFSATATDPQETLPSSAFTWQMQLLHCPSGVCHTHPFGSSTGASGSVTAPPHEYPSKVLLQVTVTDSGGLTDSRTVQLDPKTVDLTFASSPSGAGVTVGESAHTAPWTETFIQKSPVTVTAAPTTGTGASIAAFSSWSDGGAASHLVTPGTAPATLTATYTRPTAGLSANPTSGSAPLAVTYTASGTNAPGVTGGFTYAWDLDNDGQYDDGTGSTQSKTYAAAGSPVVRVLVTDSRGATDAKSVTVQVGAPVNHAPVAKIVTTPTPATGPAPLSVGFDGRTSTDADAGDTLTYDWDLDGNGSFETTNDPTPSRSYGIGTTTVGLRVTDNHGASSTATTTVSATNTAPTITSMSPAASATWSVGQTIGYSAAATDAQETLGDSRFTWLIERQDCASACSRTAVATSTGKTGSFTVPELPYPSHLFLTVTVTDTQGLTATLTRQFEPKTADLTFTTAPSGGVVTVAGADHGAPFQRTFVQGAHVTVTVPDTRTSGGANYGFASWSDGGARSHQVTVPTAATTYTATYARQNRAPTVSIAANPSSGPAPLASVLTATPSDPDGDDTTFIFAWDLDDDGEYDDATGAQVSRSFSGVGPHQVRVRVTDAHEGTGTGTATVTVLNSGPTAKIVTMPANPTGNAPLSVTFDGSQSADPDGGPLTYAWDLDGDGQLDDGTLATVTRSYAVGTTTVRLRVTDTEGASSEATVVVVVPNRAPVVAVSADPTSGPGPLAVSLSAAGSTDPDGTALTYAWDLDDDGAFDDATGATTGRTFSEVGTHQVTVRVQDADGGVATKAVTVTVTNTGPVARIVTDPASAGGPAPLVVGFDASSSVDPDGGQLTYAWDLDGDGAYDDGVGATAAGTYQVGVTTVGLKVTDPDGTSATTSATVTATNTAPSLTRVTTYPAGGFYTGQTLGFDAAASDPQQALGGSAFSFVMLRQDCDSCPRVELQRWAQVSNAQFLVPQLPATGRLWLVASAVDDHGAVGSRELRIDPQVVSLRVKAKPRKLRTKGSGPLVRGSTVRVTAPRKQLRKGVRWVFVRWSDGGARRHDVTVWDPEVVLTAVYKRKR